MELKLNPDYNDYSVRGIGFCKLKLKDYSQDELKKLWDLGNKEFFLQTPLKTPAKETTTITNTIPKDILTDNDTN